MAAAASSGDRERAQRRFSAGAVARRQSYLATLLDKPCICTRKKRARKDSPELAKLHSAKVSPATAPHARAAISAAAPALPAGPLQHQPAVPLLTGGLPAPGAGSAGGRRRRRRRSGHRSRLG